MSDKGSEEVSLHARRVLVRRIPVAAGSFVALISLVYHVPVSVAALRGAAAYLAVLLVLKLGFFALEKSLAADLRARGGGKGESP